MKRRLLCALLLPVLLLAACGHIPSVATTSRPGTPTIAVVTAPSTEPAATESAATEAADPVTSPGAKTPWTYDELKEIYADAVRKGWSAETLAKKDLCAMIADCRSRLGYAIADLDGNGVNEFIVGTIPATDNAFFDKMILDLYSVDEDGNCIHIFSGRERNRYFYAGGSRFANVGANSAFDSIDTTLALKGVVLSDTRTVTDSKDYVQMELFPIRGVYDVSRVDMPILDEIRQDVRLGTAGAYLTAVEAAAKLLNWATFTGLDPQEIRVSTETWLGGLDAASRAEFIRQLTQVEEACQDLLGGKAEELLSSAGISGGKYYWDEGYKEALDAVLEAAGLR